MGPRVSIAAMEMPGWLLLLGYGLLAFLAFYSLKVVFDLWSGARVHGAWRRLGEREGLKMLAEGLRAAPRLEGDFRGRPALVRGIHSDWPRKGLNTRSELQLARRSPLRLRIRRAGPMALLRDLAEAGFRAEKVKASDAIELDGDREVIRELLRGRLTALLQSLDEWHLEIGEDMAALERPGLVSSEERLEEDLALLADLADRLEAR